MTEKKPDVAVLMMEPKDRNLRNLISGKVVEKGELKWWYTLYKGGELSKFKSPTDEDTIQEAASQVSDRRYWGVYPRGNPFQRGARKEYTRCLIIPDYPFRRIFELGLPNGWIWDSELRMFKTTDEDGNLVTSPKMPTE